jgi:4-amino-4-deoxy-L-arabinose transferase-like glycosyltransferase
MAPVMGAFVIANRFVIAVAALALIVRVAALVAIQGSGVIDNDGTEYARVMENLRAGLGFTGMRGVTMTPFPPLYSFLIGLVALVTPNDELAGRLVSLLAGVAFVVAVFLITETLFGRWAAVMAGLLSAFVPLFVTMSTAVLTDQSYVTLMAFGLYGLLTAYRRRSVVAALLAGLCFGLAYLLRPEALFLGAASAFVAFALSLSLRASTRRAAALLGVCLASMALVAAPYVAYSSLSQGKPTFEGKLGINYLIGVRLLKGMPYNEAAQAIGDDLTPYGPELDEPISFPHPSLGQRLAFARAVAPWQARSVAETIASKRDGLTPLGLLLALFGFFRALKGRSRVALVAIVVTLSAVSFASLLAVGQYAPRYGLLILAMTVPFAAKGAYDVISWFILKARLRRKSRALTAAFGAAAVVLAVWSSAGLALDIRGDARDYLPLEKEAGMWLGAHDSDRAKAIMATSMIVGYYAHGTVVQMPFTRSASVALAYLAKKNPAYVEVLGDPVHGGPEPYSNEWADRGIPDRRAILIYKKEGNGRTIALYCWSCRDRAALTPTRTTSPVGSQQGAE